MRIMQTPSGVKIVRKTHNPGQYEPIARLRLASVKFAKARYNAQLDAIERQFRGSANARTQIKQAVREMLERETYQGTFSAVTDETKFK